MQIALFVPCINDAALPRSAVAAVLVLEKLGCQVHCPESHTCCGQPQLNNGLQPEATELAERWLENFCSFDFIVALSASCTSTVVHGYRELFDPASPYAKLLSEAEGKLYEFARFLHEVLQFNPQDHPLRFADHLTYHASCHQQSLPSDATLPLLNKLRDTQITPISPEQRCCGFGGTFLSSYAELSSAMVKDRVRDFQHSRAQTLVCNDAGCTLNLWGALRKSSCPQTRVLSLAEVLAEAWNLLPKASDPLS